MMEMTVEKSSVGDADSLELDLDDRTEESLIRIQKVMENPLILKKILYHTEGLGTARLVCSKWKPLATEFLKERNWIARKFIELDSNEKNKKFLDDFSKSKENIMRLCWEMNPWSNLPGMNFEFDPKRYSSWMDVFQAFPNFVQALKLDWNYDYLTPLFEPILRTQSESLVELVIQINWLPRDREIGHLLPKKTFSPVDYYLPCLKYLKHRLNWSVDATNVFESVLSRIPAGNKSQFVIDIDACEQISEMIGLLKKYDLVKSLRRFEMGDVTIENFEIMAHAGVELESLEFGMCGSHDKVQANVFTQGIYKFLCHQSNSLKFLIWGGYAFKFPAWGMPKMTRLELGRVTTLREEELEGQGQEEVQVQNHILYSQMFPNLNELKLRSFYQNILDFQSKFLVPQLPCNTLEKLYIPYFGINTQTIISISTIFPRIKFLAICPCSKLRGDDQTNFYSILWNAEFKSTIEELIFQFERFSWDVHELHSIFVGVPEAEIEQNFSSGPGNSSIYNYTNLKKLKLRGTHYSDQPSSGFVEASVLDIFGKIKSLEYLYVDRQICQFSPDAVKDLKKFLPILATSENE